MGNMNGWMNEWMNEYIVNLELAGCDRVLWRCGLGIHTKEI